MVQHPLSHLPNTHYYYFMSLTLKAGHEGLRQRTAIKGVDQLVKILGCSYDLGTCISFKGGALTGQADLERGFLCLLSRRAEVTGVATTLNTQIISKRTLTWQLFFFLVIFRTQSWQLWNVGFLWLNLRFIFLRKAIATETDNRSTLRWAQEHCFNTTTMKPKL